MKNDATVAVLISGGVDSLVAASLLKDRHAHVVGLHFHTGYNDLTDDQVAHLSRQLNMPVQVLDLTAVFVRDIVDYFIAAYLRGETPNPCMHCNQKIKFGAALAAARNLGAETLATGHYCRLSVTGDTVRLRQGVDAGKEQSYFLAFVAAADLAHACFPVGEMTKPAVEDLARKRGLVPVSRKESQDICFVQADTYAAFIRDHTGGTPAPGPINDMQGNHIGDHTGIHQFTVGQRRGINCPAAKPYYVAAIDAIRNTLTVGFRDELLVSTCQVSHVNWLQAPRPEIMVKVRYRHPAVAATIAMLNDDTVRVTFVSPQFGIAPGQGAVFYEGDTVVGGGIII